MKKQLLFLSLSAIIGLSSCANDSGDDTHEGHDQEPKQQEMDHTDHSQMDHSSSGEVPEGLKDAEKPTYKVGSQAMMNAGHMEGMDGAEATIVGAYDTTVYTVSYTPTTGGEKVTNHKWVIHEEIENAGDEAFNQGAEVTLKADHMKGMDGAEAVIDSAQQTTVYMVDYTSKADGEKVTNHKWVTESELSPK
ncbi:YdhK family protein [Mesobacillus foraminis]|uniref:YdhK family protein n=1 Tax=Mesobacillus foraminis TaxID=279826 RepID=UPI00399EF0BC